MVLLTLKSHIVKSKQGWGMCEAFSQSLQHLTEQNEKLTYRRYLLFQFHDIS